MTFHEMDGPLFVNVVGVAWVVNFMALSTGVQSLVPKFGSIVVIASSLVTLI